MKSVFISNGKRYEVRQYFNKNWNFRKGESSSKDFLTVIVYELPWKKLKSFRIDREEFFERVGKIIEELKLEEKKENE